MSKITPFLRNGFPKLCAGCGQPFPIRHGHIEALVGNDGALYCYRGEPECAEIAVSAPARKAA
jgi:hypothetical protein